MSEKWETRRKNLKERCDEGCRTTDPAFLGFIIFLVLTVVALVELKLLTALAFGIAAGMFRRIIDVRKEDAALQRCNSAPQESPEPSEP